MAYPNPTIEVLALAQINFEGNITPRTWKKHLRYGNGKVHLPAKEILSEIVYWYRPTVKEQNGHVYYQKKFKGKLLQKSYSELCEATGLTKQQVRDACAFLEEKGLIYLHVEKRVPISQGKVLGNVLYIGIHPNEIKRITFEGVAIVEAEENQGDEDPCVLQTHSSRSPEHKLVVSRPEATVPQAQTYTKITPENSTEITHPYSSSLSTTPPNQAVEEEKEKVSEFKNESQQPNESDDNVDSHPDSKEAKSINGVGKTDKSKCSAAPPRTHNESEIKDKPVKAPKPQYPWRNGNRINSDFALFIGRQFPPDSKMTAKTKGRNHIINGERSDLGLDKLWGYWEDYEEYETARNRSVRPQMQVVYSDSEDGEWEPAANDVALFVPGEYRFVVRAGTQDENGRRYIAEKTKDEITLMMQTGQHVNWFPVDECRLLERPASRSA